MSGRFDSTWQKIKWARKRIDELLGAIEEFAKTDPYETETVGDPWHGIGAYRIKGSPKPVPDQIPLTAGDAAHNLRAALDHFAFSAVPAPTSGTAFPIWRQPRRPSDPEWHGLVNGKLRGAASALIQAVNDLYVYESGAGEHVWAVDQLDMTDKHRLLIALAGVNSVVTIDFGESLRNSLPEDSPRRVPNMPLVLPVAEKWVPIQTGTELFRCEAPGGLRTVPRFSYGIALGEPEPLKGEPIVTTLRRLADHVEDLLSHLIPLA